MTRVGERIASRDPDRQTAEIHIHIALMNRVNALGTKIERVAWDDRGKGLLAQTLTFVTTPIVSDRAMGSDLMKR